MQRKQLFERALLKTGLYLRRHSSTILTVLGAAGVVGTTVLAIKATPKAVELIKEDSRKNHDGDPYAYTKLEAVGSCWKCYVPTAIMGSVTITCIFGANVLNKHQQASLASAYALVNSSYKEYQNKLKELYGEEADQKIREAIVIEKAKDIHISSECLCCKCDLSVEDSGSEPKLFYDEWSQRYFEATIEQVITAEYHLNRNFILRGCAMLNDFYEFLGLEETAVGSTIGWAIGDDFYWIDFDHNKVTLDDGLECYIIETPFGPDSELLEYGYY